MTIEQTALKEKPAQAQPAQAQPAMKLAVTSAKTPQFVKGRRDFFEYRDLGVTGFCSGGRQTLLFACSSKPDAAIDCWGGFIHRATPDAETTPSRPTPILDMVDRLHCPLFAVFGEEDQNPTVAQSEELRRLAQRAGKDVTIKVYKDAGHAFLADYRPSYREGPAAELWQDVVAFFDKHLKS